MGTRVAQSQPQHEPELIHLIYIIPAWKMVSKNPDTIKKFGLMDRSAHAHVQKHAIDSLSMLLNLKLCLYSVKNSNIF